MCEQFDDISQFLKSGLSFQDLYKLTRTNTFGKALPSERTAKRAENLNKRRKEIRNTILLKNRGIDTKEMNRSMSAATSKKSEQQIRMEERLEKLRQWKDMKTKKKLEQQAQQKPLFKVYHVTSKVGLPNLENVNKTIKGKLFSLEKTKSFRIANSKSETTVQKKNVNVLSKNKTKQGIKPETKLEEIKSTKKTNEQLTKPLLKIHKYNTRLSKLIESKGLAADTKETLVKRKISKPATKQIKSKETKKGTKKQEINKSSNNQCDINQTITSEVKESRHLEKTPEKNNPPCVYISPFVTISRGKDSARKEYHRRFSGSGDDSTTLKSDTPQTTGNKAAAAYFYKLLDDEKSRIQSMCNEWSAYKEETEHPEEVCGMIDVAIGQSQLLMNKKFEQFRSLIDKCAEGECNNPVTCQDLHGFWDMVYIQVNNLNKRFDNLKSLRNNNWEEILPVKKEVKKPKAVRKVKAKTNSALKDVIKAARDLKKANQSGNNVKSFDGGFFTINSPRKELEILREKTPRKSLLRRKSGMKGANNSPGLSMMKVSQMEKVLFVDDDKTPKSILKRNDCIPSTQKKKAVIFMQGGSLENCELNNQENNINILNFDQPNVYRKTPRRSARLRLSEQF